MGLERDAKEGVAGVEDAEGDFVADVGPADLTVERDGEAFCGEVALLVGRDERGGVDQGDKADAQGRRLGGGQQCWGLCVGLLFWRLSICARNQEVPGASSNLAGLAVPVRLTLLIASIRRRCKEYVTLGLPPMPISLQNEYGRITFTNG